MTLPWATQQVGESPPMEMAETREDIVLRNLTLLFVERELVLPHLHFYLGISTGRDGTVGSAPADPAISRWVCLGVNTQAEGAEPRECPSVMEGPSWD